MMSPTPGRPDAPAEPARVPFEAALRSSFGDVVLLPVVSPGLARLRNFSVLNLLAIARALGVEVGDLVMVEDQV